MKKLLLVILCLLLVGCGNNRVSNEELDAINNDIIIYLSNNQYDNLIFNYVDYENKNVVVGLSNNSIEKQNEFKLFFFDTGLLKTMAGVDNGSILLKSDYQFKGAISENYVLQQLIPQFDVAPRYFSDKNGEIDFVLQFGSEIIPVEVKAGEDKSAPSFKRYVAKNKPKYAIRFSKLNYKKDGDFTNIPLYLAVKTTSLL